MEDYCSIGHTRKTYGLTGALKLDVKDQFLDDLLEAQAVFLSLQGQLLPYFIEKIEEEPHLLIKFEEIDTPEQARDLTNAEIFMRSAEVSGKSPVDEDGLMDWEMLVGWTIYDKEDLIGEIIEIQEYPQQMMALVEFEGRDVLIPLNETFLTVIDENTQQIIMDLPEGLLAL